MKFTAIVVLGLIGIAFFTAITYAMSALTNDTVWTGMNNSAWENGFMKIIIPFAILGFTVMLALIIFKGKQDEFSGGQR